MKLLDFFVRKKPRDLGPFELERLGDEAFDREIFKLALAHFINAANAWEAMANNCKGSWRASSLGHAERCWRRASIASEYRANDLGSHPDRDAPESN